MYTCQGKSYTIEIIFDLPPAINKASLSTKVTDNLVKIFGRGSPLSNFDNCPATIKGIRYCSNEQFYQKSKSDFFKDEETCTNIMATSNPAMMFFLGQKVKDFDETR